MAVFVSKKTYGPPPNKNKRKNKIYTTPQFINYFHY